LASGSQRYYSPGNSGPVLIELVDLDRVEWEQARAQQRRVREAQARRAYRWPPNVHRTPQGRWLGRFNLFGIRWYAGTWGSIAEAEQAVWLMRRRLAHLRSQGVLISPLREVEIEHPTGAS
jgi:hypothetical protein